MANIIVVDDEPTICKFVEERLIQEGHFVMVAHKPDEAIDIGHLFRADLLIADWNLKNDYDGFEVAQAISEVRKNLRTILMTGYSEIQNPPEGLSVFGKLVKPFSLVELSYMVNRALGNWRTNRGKPK